MQKIINGKKYNTETAEQVGAYCNSCGRSDFRWFEEILYRKRTGEFFLFGEGGPASKYCTWLDDHSRCGGEKIIPMTFDDAREWAEKRLEVEEYEAIFGKVEDEESDCLTGLAETRSPSEEAKAVVLIENGRVNSVFHSPGVNVVVVDFDSDMDSRSSFEAIFREYNDKLVQDGEPKVIHP